MNLRESHALLGNVMVSTKSVESSDIYDIIWSNISVVNALFKEYLRPEEICEDALVSYYVDYYLAQVNNGGFSQFVYNSGWNRRIIDFVRYGLKEMNAVQHLALFEEGAGLVERLGIDQLETYFSSEYFGENQERDHLNALNDRFYQLSETEDLISLNANWLRQHPNLLVLQIDEMEREIAKASALIPNREQRVQEALAREPSYMKMIRALCKQADQNLVRVTVGNPNHLHNGNRIVAWHFWTDLGHYYMVETEENALMYNADSHQLITQLSRT